MTEVAAFHAPPPLEKALENRYKVEMHVHSPICLRQLIEKKIRSITFVVWALGKVEKNAEKSSINVKNTLF